VAGSVRTGGVPTGALLVEAAEDVAGVVAGRATNGISRGSIGAESGAGSDVTTAPAVVSAVWADGAAGGSSVWLIVSSNDTTGLATGGAGSLEVWTGTVGAPVRAEVLGLAEGVAGSGAVDAEAAATGIELAELAAADVPTVGPADWLRATATAGVWAVRLVDAVGALGAAADLTAEPAAGGPASLAAVAVAAPTSFAALALPAAGAGVEGGVIPVAAGCAPVAPAPLEIRVTSSCSAALASFAVESTSAPTSVAAALAVALLLGELPGPALATRGEATSGRLKPAAAPDGATADVDVGGVSAAGVTGVGGPSTAIRAAKASLKPSLLRPAAGALAGSRGSGGFAVVTWAEAASMAPMKRVVRKGGACCAGTFGPLKQPLRHRRKRRSTIGKISTIWFRCINLLRRARRKLPRADRQGRPVWRRRHAVWRRSCAGR